jgi:hypothetical protein
MPRTDLPAAPVVCRCRPVDPPDEWQAATNPWTAAVGRALGAWCPRLLVTLGGPRSSCQVVVSPHPCPPAMARAAPVQELPAVCEPVVEVLGEPVTRERARPPVIVVDAQAYPLPVAGRRRLRSGGRIPRGFTMIARADGRYDHLQQDGEWLLLDLEEGRVLDGSMDDEREQRGMIDRMNRIDAVCRGVSDIARQAGDRIRVRSRGPRTKAAGGRR